MKILLLTILFVALIEGNELYYYAGGEKINLHTYTDKISVTWQKDVTTEDKENILRSKPEIKFWYDLEKYQVTILEADETKAQTLLVELWSLPQVEFAHFILHTGQNDSLILTNELIVKLNSSLSIEEIESEYQVELLREDPFDDTYKVLKVHKESQFNALEITNMLTEEKRVVYACPNFISRIEMHRDPNDDLYPYQWGLPKIGAPLAWDYETGSPSIKIAIIDAGVDLGHPDIQNAIVTGYDAVDGDNTPQCNSTDGHGTCCAGIAAAITNNNNEGVAGVAGGWGSSGGCRIMPMRISTPWVSDDDIKYCLEWAANHGAKVLSNSWGYPGYSYRDPIHNGIKYAYDQGSLVFFSSGNENEFVHYPAADEFSVAVGGTNFNDEKYSLGNYGYNLDITAPTRDAGLSGIYSTDNRGSGGYASGDYYFNFGGTSASCPHVAGLAGLLFSANSNLEHFDVERIIKIFAYDLGDPAWDPLYGYGRIDAANAVKHVILPYELTKSTASTPTKIATEWRTFINRPRPEMPEAGMYYCDVYEVEQTVNFAPSYAAAPWGWFSFIGYSNANPNYCTEYLYHSSLPSSITLRTYFYYVKTGIHAGKWIPANPYSYATKYTVLGRKAISTPTNFQATAVASSNDIKLTWTDNSNNELKFKIERSTNGTTFYLYDSVGQNVRQYVDNGTTQGQKYWYKVQAWAQEFYSGFSNVDDAVAGLAAPSNLIAVNLPTLTSVKLQWADNSLIEAGFQIARRVDDGAWNDNYKTVGDNVTQYTDTVSFMHKYYYKVRAFDNQSNYSEWSNTIEFTSGALAQSNYPEMSAYNNGDKVVKNGDNVYVTYAEGNWGNREMHILHSTDGGSSFTDVFNPYPEWGRGYISHPAITMDDNGTPYATWGVIYWPSGDEDDSWLRRYYCAYYVNDSWQIKVIYGKQINEDPLWQPIEDSIASPSITTSSDSGYVAFKIVWSNKIRVARFLLSNPNNQHDEIIPNTAGVPGAKQYVSIGYDPGSKPDPSRIVVAWFDNDIIKLHYRSIGSERWSNVELTNCDACGSPSLWVGTNKLRVAFEGYDYGPPYAAGLLSTQFLWSSVAGDYIPEPVEFITQNCDYPNIYHEGYTYLAAEDVVLWWFEDDIWYSRKLHGEWTRPNNTSRTPEQYSSYPQGITFWDGKDYKLIALWTEQVGNDYCLIRNIITIPNATPPDASGPQGNDAEYTGLFKFENIYPNPTKGVMKIRFMSPSQRRVTVNLYDVTGRVVENIFDGEAKNGLNEIPYSGKNLASGVYFVRLIADDKAKTEKIIFYR